MMGLLSPVAWVCFLRGRLLDLLFGSPVPFDYVSRTR